MINDDKKTIKRFSVTLPIDIYEKLLKESEYEDRSVDKMAAKIIKDYYKTKKD